MLKSLKLKNVGPAPSLEIEFSKRLNLLTGDNGLGKSFLLDVAWWALTRRWPHDLNGKMTSGYRARPTMLKEKASITFNLSGKINDINYISNYNPLEQAWVGKQGRPWNPGLVIYAHADGGFSVWDPARNYWKTGKKDADTQERLPGYVFTQNDLWDGLSIESGTKTIRVCNGILIDWTGWIKEKGAAAEMMERVIAQLSPQDEKIAVGTPVRMSVDDSRDVPSICTSYAERIPILHASSGVRRIVGMAYILLWSWLEHQRASELIGQPPTKQVVLLVDELESHLHPRWQRTILDSLLGIAGTLHQQAEIQLIAATHSPLVLASAEPTFNAETDAWHDFDLVDGRVKLQKRTFVQHGDVSNWLTSNAFDLSCARSVKAERAIDQALALLREPNPSREAIKAADLALREARLPDIDPFWVRWSHFRDQALHGESRRPRVRK